MLGLVLRKTGFHNDAVNYFSKIPKESVYYIAAQLQIALIYAKENPQKAREIIASLPEEEVKKRVGRFFFPGLEGLM